MPNLNRRLLSPPAMVLLALLGGCETVPETGRSQLLLISPAQETQLGLSEFEKRLFVLKMEYEKHFSGIEQVEPLREREELKRMMREFSH